jgi:hypothetical protein
MRVYSEMNQRNAIAVVDPAIVSTINDEHNKALASANSALTHARLAGEMLHKAKEQLPHGQWLPWVAATCQFSERTAQAYMRIAARWSTIEAKAQTSADLSVSGAVKLLAGPATTTTKDKTVDTFQIADDEMMITEGWLYPHKIIASTDGVPELRDDYYSVVIEPHVAPGYFHISVIEPFHVVSVTPRAINKSAIHSILRSCRIPAGTRWERYPFDGTPSFHDACMGIQYPCRSRVVGSDKCRHCDATWQACAPAENRAAWADECERKRHGSVTVRPIGETEVL